MSGERIEIMSSHGSQMTCEEDNSNRLSYNTLHDASMGIYCRLRNAKHQYKLWSQPKTSNYAAHP